jgi:quercetin dioxygenase-like cupin family protein
MFDIANSNIPTQEQILKLQSEMLSMDQVELPTEHYFSGGMYCRKVFRKAGTVIVGKIHKKDHFFMCAKGEIIAWSENGMKKLLAGDIIESKSGTKRVTFALSDAIGITFHKTDKTDLDEIEAELLEPDELALFDSSNKLKKFAVTNQKTEILEGSIL